jgi:Tol biopolymer transport system component
MRQFPSASERGGDEQSHNFWREVDMRARVGVVLTAVMCAALLNACAYLTRASETPQGVSPPGDAEHPDLSYDGRYVTFDSAAALDATDTNGVRDVYVRDNHTAAISRVSVATNGIAGDAASADPAISDNGRFVAFESSASNLSANDINGVSDVFWHDRDADGDGIFDEPGSIQTIAISMIHPTQSTGNGPSTNPSISADGSFLGFESLASNLDPSFADTNSVSDIFGTIVSSIGCCPQAQGSTLLSHQGPDPANGPSRDPDIRIDGTAQEVHVTFVTGATNLTTSTDTNDHDDVVVLRQRDPATRTIVPVTGPTPLPNADQFTPRFVGNSTKIVYASAATNLTPGDTGGQIDVFLTDYLTGATSCVSRTSTGAEANGDSYEPSPSADGTRIAFTSNANDLVPTDTNDALDVFVNAAPGFTQRTSTTALLGQTDYDLGTTEPALSGDGVYVAFSSIAHNLETPDTNPNLDIFVRAAVVPEIASVVAIDPNTQAENPPVLHGGTNELLVKGRGFGPAVSVLLGGGVTVSVLSVQPDRVRLRAVVAAGTSPGSRTLSVANLGSGIGLTNGSMQNCANCVQIEP